ncbi:zinc finger, C2H2 type [Ancylostoma ceylanicum]|uniref:Zinc finger, C2H2 type n=1 Tax=Ancylostoma ceylanicum TaxID=53326 RepID=A0A0D6LGN4_9BILA|nr:zinc finger, C2H2 type [Ancylostoma ceylanicum]
MTEIPTKSNHREMLDWRRLGATLAFQQKLALMQQALLPMRFAEQCPPLFPNISSGFGALASGFGAIQPFWQGQFRQVALNLLSGPQRMSPKQEEGVPKNTALFSEGPSPSTENVFPCFRCTKLFSSSAALEVIHAFHTPAHPFGHTSIPLRVLWKALPPKERHEEAHLHPHRLDAIPFACDVCGRTFQRKVDRRRHRETHHPGQLEDIDSE